MARGIQRNPRNFERSLYHFGLVKILVENKLQKKNDNWIEFLVWNQFVEALVKQESHEGNPGYCKAKGLKQELAQQGFIRLEVWNQSQKRRPEIRTLS
jgi:hypothetical protein